MGTDPLLVTLSLMKQKPEGAEQFCNFGVCDWLPFLALSNHSNPSILGTLQRGGREGSGGADPRSRAG